jgi:hypothetical protein
MMDLRQKFNRELWISTDIPMKEYCVKKAERLILNEHDLSILFDHEIFESLVEDNLFKFWRRHASLKPNHRWNCIEADLNGEWFNNHSGHVKESVNACGSTQKIR